MLLRDQKKLQLPIVDISSLDKDTGDLLVAAAAKYGFVYIKSTGLSISAERVDEIFALSKNFFQSPRESKEICAINATNRGWAAMHSEILDPEHQRRGDFKEAFNLAEYADGKPQQPLPKALGPHADALGQFADLCHDLCNKILRLFALGLKIDPDDGGEEWFSSWHNPSKGPSGCTLRLLYYPDLHSFATSYDASTDIRAGAHSDYGSMTLLFQRPSQPGLEILDGSTWSPVVVSPPGTETDPFPPILVNIGDVLSYWTNGLLKSTVHRVVFPAAGDQGDRYSIAYFCHPVDATPLVSVPSKIVETRSKAPKRVGDMREETRVMTAGEHLQSRLQATYRLSKQDDSVRGQLTN